MQWQRQRLRQTAPPLYCTADVILLSVPPGDYSPGKRARQCTMWRYKHLCREEGQTMYYVAL